MKKLFLLLLIAYSLQLSAGSKIKDPVVEYTPSWIQINEIELNKDATVIRCTLRNRPNWWVMVSDKMFIRDRNAGKEYKILRVDDIEINKEIYMPQSGEKLCTIYFEPIGKKVKEFNIIEKGSRDEGQVYGVRLQSNKKVMAKGKTPMYSSMDAGYYMKQDFTPDYSWKFTNERYKDMSFYKSGKAYVIIHADNIPRELRNQFKSIGIRVQDQITKKENNVVATLNDENCYLADLSLTSPQFMYFSELGNIFVQLGDTTHIYTTMEKDSFGTPRYTTFRGNSESALINTFANSLIKELVEIPGFNHDFQAIAKKGREEVTLQINILSNKIVKLIGSEEVTKKLNATPLSTFGKDIVMTSALCKLVTDIEDLRMYYTFGSYVRKTKEDGCEYNERDSTFANLDYEAIYEPLVKYKSLIFDNPLVMCESQQWVFINRVIFASIFNEVYMALHPEEYDGRKDGYVEYKKLDGRFDMMGTFMNDIRLAQNAESRYKHILSSYQLGKCETERMDAIANNTADMLMRMKYRPIAQTVMNEYRDLVRRVEVGNNNAGIETGWTDEQKALWNRIVSPYKGNILLADFWGMGCGPCRRNMMDMRDKVEAMKGESFKFLYISNDNDAPRDVAEKWMAEKEIKGEHIFVSNTEWQLLESMFSFTGIPHAAFIGRDGKVIQNAFRENVNVELLKGLLKKF